MKHFRAATQSAGFTFIEVMVALAVFAVAFAAGTAAVQGYANNLIHVKERTLASWMASNELARLRIERQWPDVGRKTLDLDYAGVEWKVTLDVSETDVEALRRIDAEVSLANDAERKIYTMVGFLGKPTNNVPAVSSWAAAGLAGSPNDQNDDQSDNSQNSDDADNSGTNGGSEESS